MSYSETSFKNNPEMASSPGVLYVLVLVEKKTGVRACIKIGITKGSSYKSVSTRAGGFGPYEHRVQKIIKGTLLEVYQLEQRLHQKFKSNRFYPPVRFGGHTECFDISILKDILLEVNNAS